MNTASYEPFDPQVIDNPYPAYAVLRRQAPVHQLESMDMKVISRYSDVAEVLKRPESFSSAPYGEFISAAMALANRGATLEGETLLGSDPPAHGRLRKIVNRGFLTSRISALEPRIREFATDLVRNFAQRGECDLVAEYASPIPVMVIAEILGVDLDRREDFKRWSDDMLLAVTGVLDEDERRSLARSMDELGLYVEEVVAARTHRPNDDMISALILAEGDEDSMSAQEVANFIQLLLIAGNEATSHLIANAVLVLATHPAVAAAVDDDASLIPALVEETLRYDAPVQMILRRSVATVSIAGTRIRSGETLGLLIGSANRDDRRFTAAERFDLSRGRPAHLSFGHGIHFCLGAELSRLEAVVSLEVLLGSIKCIERTDQALERPTSFLVRGPGRLGLTFEPQRHARVVTNLAG